MPSYTPTSPVNCDVDFDYSTLKGKTAIVTGGKFPSKPFTHYISRTDYKTGANGLGEAYVRSLVTAGYGSQDNYQTEDMWLTCETGLLCVSVIVTSMEDRSSKQSFQGTLSKCQHI